MKRFRYIVLFLALAMSWCGGLRAQVPVKQLPEVTSTEGREFFVAWLPNGGTLPSDQDLRLMLIASSRKSNTIVVEMPDGSTKNYPIAGGQSVEIVFDLPDKPKIYWDLSAAEEETPLRKGIRVYSLNDEKFTLYSINQYGITGTYSFDGAHILPVEALGTEYIVQTADADEMATEFVIMTTKPGTTNVTIDLPVNSNKGKTQHIDIPLSGSKQIYIVRSKAPNPEDPDDVIDLSGSTICADQPIAVWSGNQLASVPNQDAMSKDHAYDQLLPVTKWGKKFLIPPTGNHTQYNEIHVSGLLDNTSVVVRNLDGTKNWTMSSRDDSIVVLQGPLGGNLDGMETYIEADKPIQVYLYSSAGAANPYDAIEGGVRKRHLQGDPAMTIIPPLEYLTDTTVFQTYNGGDGGLVHEMRLWARTSDVSGIRLNGNDISSQFSTTPYVSGYSIATIPLTHRIYTITAPKKCFSGYVYGMNDGQTYMYPVGYDFTPQKDTLFLLDNSRQYDVHHDGAPSEEWKANYVSNTEGGWFLDKVLQNDDTYLLDSTFVCDSTILDFPIKTYNAWYKTVWEIEGSIQGRGYFTPIEQLAEDVVRPQLEHQFHLLPIAQNQEPFEDFEVRGIVIRKPIFCDIPEDKWERDTFNTVVRVMRQYNDTTWHVMCIGDTIKFFYDSLYDQGNLSRYDATQKDSTMFIATRSGAVNPNKWQYNIGTGSYAFTRHYTTVNGCDSLSTIKVYVCDSYFEHKDTVVCEDGLSKLGDKYGDFFKKYSQYNPTRWPKADTVLLDTLRAKGCMGSDDYQEFRKHCPTFNGCDSILELHLVVKTVINNTTIANVCKSQLEEMGGVYIWTEKGSGREIKRYTPDEVGWDSPKTYRENVKYVDCDNCPQGGCDSVRNTLRRSGTYIPCMSGR